MGCLVVLFAMLSPRIAIAFLWAFTNRMTIAFDSGFIAFAGFLFFPWTTLLFAIAYAPVGGVSGLGWFLVGIGFITDLGSIFGGARYRTAV